jgi:hypothetical protein
VAVLRRVSDDTPRPVRAINADVPEWLEAIIAKLHAKDPAERFQSASEAADLLSRCLAHVQEPLAVPLPSELASGSAAVDVRRRKSLRLWAGFALVSLATIVGGAVWTWPRATIRHKTEREPSRSAQKAVDAPVRSTTVWGRADEIEHEFADAWGRAQAVNSELHRSIDHQGSDPVSGLARALADRALALEQEIRAVRGAKP